MVIKNSYKRLDGAWGVIDLQHNKAIAAKVKGRVLDIGCGYGSLVNYLSLRGFDAIGIDSDKRNIQIAKKLFPRSKFILDKAEDLKILKNNYYDSIVLKDSLHHIVGESDGKEAFKKFRKKLRKNGTLVILDPNPVLILKLGRKLLANNCPQVTLKEAKNFITDQGFSIKEINFLEVIGIFFSGGYIGYDLTLNSSLLKTVVSKLNVIFSMMLNLTGMGKYFCWRYLIVAKNKIY